MNPSDGEMGASVNHGPEPSASHCPSPDQETIA